MGLRYDEKGKFFTELIPKTEIPVIIQTDTNLIRGFIYVRKGERLSDELNSSRYFIPVVDAMIYDADGEIRNTSDFLAIHRDHIIWLMPESDEPEKKQNASGGDA